MIPQWEGFKTGLWQKEIDVRDFIQQNCAPYGGDESFLRSATERTKRIWNRLNELFVEERRKGVLDMKRRIARASLGFFLMVTAPAIAQEPPVQEQETKNEITLFGGISILDASGSSEWMFGMGNFPGIPGFPMFPGFPGRIPDITARGESSLGSSALFGARYSRHIKDRLALEADFAIAPTHDLELGGELCLEGFGCYGDGRELGGRSHRGFGGRGETAWHYGGGLAYELTDSDVRPFLLVGAGGVTWDGASDTDFVFRFGAGLKVLFGNVGARVDVIDHLVVDHFLSGGNEHDIHATAGLLVGF